MKMWAVFLVLIPNLVSAQSWFQTYQQADLMLFGVDFNNTGGALMFNHPSSIASDGTRFLLCDRFNNRVLIWNNLPIRWDDPPDLVLGQQNFITNYPGTSKGSKGELNFPGDVSVGANGVVTIADTENDRILSWRQFPTSNGQPADISLHLSKFVNCPDPWPWGVWTDGMKLVASATHGGTLLFWNTLPTIDDQPPDYSISLPEFGTLRHISTDGATYFFVGDHNARVGGNRAGTFFWNSFPTQADQPYDFFLSATDGWIKGIKMPDGKLIAGGLPGVYIWNNFPTASRPADVLVRNPYYSNGDGPGVVWAGERLYVNNYNGNNVQVYNGVPTGEGQLPDFALGSPSIGVNTLDSINYIQNPVLATDGNVLIAASDFDRKLWIWKTVSPQSGQAPDVRIPLWNPNIVDIAPWDIALHNGRLVLAGQNKIAVWNSLPLHGEPPSYVLTNHIGWFSLGRLTGVALDDRFFYLADETGGIAIWQDLPVTGNEAPFAFIPKTIGSPFGRLHSDGTYLSFTIPQAQSKVLIYRVADIAQGVEPQPYKTITGGPPPLLPLNLPHSAIAFNGSFAIANTGNNSVLLWKNIEDAGDTSKVVVLEQPSLWSREPGNTKNGLFSPASLAAHGNFLWVGEFKFSSRILRFNDGNITSVETNNERAVLPGKFILYQNYPNPFNPSTVISFQLPVNSHVTLKVFDVLGREVATLVDGTLEAGNHTVTFAPYELVAGIYFYKVTAGKFSYMRKAVLVK